MIQAEKKNWSLRWPSFGLILQWSGMTWEAIEYQTPFDQLFFQLFNMNDTWAHTLDVGLSFLGLLCAVLYFWRGHERWAKLAGLSGLLICSFLWIAGTWYSQPDPLSISGIVVLAESTLRWALPLCLLYDGAQFIALCTFALAATFFGHGLEALAGQGEFLDFLMDFMHNTFAYDLPESWARTILSGIAMWDLSLALLILAYPRKIWWILTAFWGFSTALERIFYWGMLQGLALFLQRALHWVVPIAIAKYYQENKNFEEEAPT